MKILVFDGGQQRDRDRYKWLYIGFNLGAGAAIEQGDKGPAVAKVNANILDALDALSDPLEDVARPIDAWPDFSLEFHGFVARTLHDGPQTLTLKDSELNRLKASVNAAALRMTPVIQRRFFLDLFEFLEGAKCQETSSVP